MKHKFFGTFIFLFFCCAVFAQQRNITGLVKDAANGLPLGFVPFVVKGKNIQGTTDQAGGFSVSAATGDTLEFTLLGKRPQIQRIGTSNVYDITMYDDVNLLEEVVIIAFGEQKKESVISAISTVKVSDLKIAGSNLTTALGGRIPGLISYQTSGEPGRDNADFFIRGVTTFGYKTDPLYLIDGFEATKDDLARIPFDDIESFSVLKDAPATVLYGSRAANGIIIVTTKRGLEGPVRLSFRIESHLATPTRIPQLADGVDYMRMYNEAQLTRNPILGSFYDEQKIQATMQGLNPMIYPNINWYDEIFKNQTINTRASLNLRGGGQVANYFVSGGYEHENGLLKVDPMNRYNSNISINRMNIRSNVTFKLTPTTTLDTQVQGRFTRYMGPSTSTTTLFNQVMNSNPVDFPTVFKPDAATQYAKWTLFGSTFVNGARKVNPFAEMTRGYRDSNSSTFNAHATLMQKLDFVIPGLEFQLRGSVETTSSYEANRTYTPFYYALDSYNQITGEHVLWCLNPNEGQPRLGGVSPTRNATFRYYLEGRASWGRRFDVHNVLTTLVGTMEERLENSGATSIFETLPEKNVGLSGRVAYDYDTRYFIEFNYGYNGSEKFDASKRFGFYPAIAGGWLVSNESFWLPIKDVFSTLKLKANIGKMGNDAISGRSGRFFYLSDISTRGETSAISGGYRWGESFMNAFGGYTINRYANPDITWEETVKWNVGAEAYFFRDKLKFQVDRFGEKRSQIYMTRENFPATVGLSAAISGNVGQMEAWGWDGSVDYRHEVNKDLWIEGRFNFTLANNKYTRLDERAYADLYLRRLGHHSSQQWGLIAERLFVDEEEIRNSPKQDFGNYMAGDIKYKDINGDGIVNTNDRVPLGFPTSPRFQYGAGISSGYKKLDFSFFFEGTSMVSFFIDPGASGTSGIAPFQNRRNAIDIVARDYWSETNPNVYAFWPRLSTTPIDNNMQQSSWWLRDGSFTRLKSVEVGYAFNNIARNKIGIKSARFYFTIDNLFAISRFKLWDPELRRSGLGYPINKRFNIGVQGSF